MKECMTRKKRFILLNFFIPGSLHLYFNEFWRFILVFTVTLLFFMLTLMDFYAMMRTMYDSFIVDGGVVLPEKRFIYRILLWSVAMSIVTYVSIRYCIARFEKEESINHE